MHLFVFFVLNHQINVQKAAHPYNRGGGASRCLAQIIQFTHSNWMNQQIVSVVRTPFCWMYLCSVCDGGDEDSGEEVGVFSTFLGVRTDCERTSHHTVTG